MVFIPLGDLLLQLLLLLLLLQVICHHVAAHAHTHHLPLLRVWVKNCRRGRIEISVWHVGCVEVVAPVLPAAVPSASTSMSVTTVGTTTTPISTSAPVSAK